MHAPQDRCIEFSVEVSPALGEGTPGYVASVVLKELPAGTELLREDPADATQVWPQPDAAMAAAMVRGRHYVRMELMRDAAATGPGGTPAGGGP